MLYQSQPNQLLLTALRNRYRTAGIDSPVSAVDKEPYIYRAGRRGVKGTLDQLDIQLDAIRDYYFCKPDDSFGLHFCQRPSVLNVLLHFTKDKLVVDDHKLVCRYRTVDEWHEATSLLGEDLFTTSYLAARDLYKGGRPRSVFLWEPYLGVETNDVNILFSRDISELHAHVKGSSMNFELSWLSLMNYPSHREKAFLELFESKKSLAEDKKMRDYNELYHSVALAVALRLYFFERRSGGNMEQVEAWIKKLAFHDTPEEIQVTLNEISGYIWACRFEYGRTYKNIGRADSCPDYAIQDKSYSLQSVLSGERSLLYHAFRYAYDGDDKAALYLYAYIIFKQQLRDKIVQRNEVVGFANFSHYERRKSLFIPDGSVYEHLLTPMAFLGFLQPDNPKRYMEGRVTPKKTVAENSCSIRNMDADVAAWLSPDEREDVQLAGYRCRKTFNGHYIFHFIKGSDGKPADLSPRHSKLRRNVKRQAIALYDYRSNGYLSASRVVGIDAANSEIKCRPEVFAQAFRFLRRHPVNDGVEHHPSSLGLTYHVGEDFYDIVDGLRAVDEVLTFMNFRSNDRLGHALVLGTDVRKYYEGRGRMIRSTRQVLLDNFVWLYICVSDMEGRTALCEYLEQEARYLYKEIYEDNDCDIPFNIHDYYESWLLRGDNPETAGRDNYKAEDSISEWGKFALNDADKEVCKARGNKQAGNLYWEYHYNRKAKEAGSRAVVFAIAHNHYEDFVSMVDKVRERLLCKVERLHIAIECNPTSNLRIGEMTSYIEHPIFRFNNYGLKTPYPPHEISVSINTDDSGVFSTSLEREYALMGIALEKTDDENFRNSPRAVKEWLNRVRKMSVEQRFKREHTC